MDDHVVSQWMIM